MNSINITKDQLQAALRAWEQDFRDGNTLSHEESATLSVDEIAAASTDALWSSLSQE